MGVREQQLCWQPAHVLVDKIKRQDVPASEVIEIFIARIEKLNPLLNAFCTCSFDIARQQAQKVDSLVREGINAGTLAGIPTGIKDLIITGGIRTTFGGKLWEHNVPVEDEVAVQRLKAAGAVILGKTNTSELGHVPIAINSIFGHSNNPWDLERTTGGSSGGAAAACACGLAPLNLGTDLGGSVRIPSSFCGTFGFKPTLGRVPMYPHAGINGWGLDHYGPITRYVKDAALMLDAIKGPDPGDRLSLTDAGPGYFDALQNGMRPKKLKIACSTSLGFVKAIEPEVAETVTRAAHRLEQVGWAVEDAPKSLKLKSPEDAFIMFEGMALTFDYRKVAPAQRGLISPTLLRMIENAQKLTPMDIMESLYRRVTLHEDYNQFFKNYDLLITPTVAVTPFAHGIWSPKQIAGKGASPCLWFAFCYVCNMAGLPAASIPCGFSKEGLPIGMLIVGPCGADLRVLEVAQAFEDIAPWQDKIPPMAK